MAVPGYAGKILKIDLTTESMEEEVLDEATLRRWMGGVGLGAKYLYEEVPTTAQWDDPENRLIVATGPLGGTRAGGSGTISISAKGPLTNGATSTQANGFMGAFMKFAGYDALVFSGIADRWLYLYLHDGVAELRDAQFLMGKDTWETEDAVKAELGYKEKAMSVFSIGPAGENLVKFAGIFGDKDHAAGHNGVGAVMGSKRLKAFCAAKGRSSVTVSEPKQVAALSNNIWNMIEADPQAKGIFYWGTGGTYETADARTLRGTLPVKNYTTNEYPETRLMTNQYAREHWDDKGNPCWACRSHHCHMITFTDGPYAGQTVEEPEYELYAAWGPLVGITDPAETLYLNNLVTRLGLEGNEAGFLVSMVQDLYEQEALSTADTGGLELRWGNAEAIKTLLERISHREEGFPNVLAEGTKRAAEALGPAALACGIYTMKGHSPRGHDHRANWREMFDTSTSDIGTYSSGNMGPPDPDVPTLVDTFSPEEVSTHTAKSKGKRQFDDVLGTCTFCTRVPLANMVEMLNAVTGWDVTAQEAQDVGFRTANVMRAFNLKHGVSIETEKPSPRWSSSPVDGPVKGVSIAPHWDGMVNNYYEQMGWDRASGRPLPETLKALGLDEVSKELWAEG